MFLVNSKLSSSPFKQADNFLCHTPAKLHIISPNTSFLSSPKHFSFCNCRINQVVNMYISWNINIFKLNICHKLAKHIRVLYYYLRLSGACKSTRWLFACSAWACWSCWSFCSIASSCCSNSAISRSLKLKFSNLSSFVKNNEVNNLVKKYFKIS